MHATEFREWLYLNGYTVKTFADYLKINRATVYRWMQGHQKPRMEKLMLIRKLTKNRFMKPEDLLDKKSGEEK